MFRRVTLIFNYSYMKKVFLLLISALALAGCNHHPEKTDRQVASKDSIALRVALMPTVDCLPFYFAKEQGIYDSLQANIEIKNYMAQMDCDTAFCRKHVEVSYTDLVRASLLQSKDTALNVIMQTDGGHELISAFSKRIKSPKQLKEKMVAMARHSVTDLLCDEIVNKAGISTDELYKPQINDIALRANMVENATIDAAFLPEPYATEARIRKNRCIYSTKKENIHMMAMMASWQALKDPKKAELIRKLLQGYDIAVKKLKNKDCQDTARNLLKAFGIRQHTLDSLRLPKYHKATVPDAGQVQKAIQWLKSKELIKNNYNGDTLVAPLHAK